MGTIWNGHVLADFMSASDYENPKCNRNIMIHTVSTTNMRGGTQRLQIGPAPSQLHTFPVPKNSSYEWTEWFKSWESSDLSKLHSPIYKEAVREVDKWMKSKDGMQQKELEDIDKFMENLADVAPKKQNIIYEGMPWGGLREKLVGPIIQMGLLLFSLQVYERNPLLVRFD